MIIFKIQVLLYNNVVVSFKKNLYYSTHYNSFHKNLVSNGDGATVVIKIMYKEFKTNQRT